LPERPPLAARGHGILDLGDVVGRVDRRVELTGGDEPGDLADEGASLGLGRLPVPAREPEPPHGQVAEDERLRLDRAGLAAHAAVVDERRAPAEARRETAGRRPADRVDAEADPGVTDRVADAPPEVVAVDENDVAAGLAHDRSRLVPPHQVHRSVTPEPGQLHEVQAHRRVGRILEHPLVRFEGHELAQEECRRRRVDRHHRELQRVSVVRQRHELGRLDDDVRRPGAASCRQEHQLTDWRSRRVRAELGDPADTLAASDRRQRRQLPVLAGQRQDV